MEAGKLRRASEPSSPRAGLLRHLLAALFIVPQTLPVAASVWVELTRMCL